MSRVDLTLLGITREDAAAALASEQRPWLRKRILAVKMVLNGATVPRAAKAAKLSIGTVGRYLRRVREMGRLALVYDGRKNPRVKRFGRDMGLIDRAALNAALARTRDRHIRKRLIAVDLVLAGEPIEAVSAQIGVEPNTMRGWIRDLKKNGFASLLPESESA